MSSGANRVVVRLLKRSHKEAVEMTRSVLEQIESGEPGSFDRQQITAVRKLDQGLRSTLSCTRYDVVSVLSPADAELLAAVLDAALEDGKKHPVFYEDNSRIARVRKIVKKIREDLRNPTV